jgi:hypothetical protein
LVFLTARQVFDDESIFFILILLIFAVLLTSNIISTILELIFTLLIFAALKLLSIFGN